MMSLKSSCLLSWLSIESRARLLNLSWVWVNLKLFLKSFNLLKALSAPETETGKEQKMCTATQTSPKNALELHPVNWIQQVERGLEVYKCGIIHRLKMPSLHFQSLLWDPVYICLLMSGKLSESDLLLNLLTFSSGLKVGIQRRDYIIQCHK